MIPGEYKCKNEEIILNEYKRYRTLYVKNTGDRPVQVGSHFHFFEVNKLLSFDRKHAYGYRLNLPAGNAIRFEPGDGTEVELVEIGGKRFIEGLNNLVDGFLDDSKVRKEAFQRAKEKGFMHKSQSKE